MASSAAGFSGGSLEPRGTRSRPCVSGQGWNAVRQKTAQCSRTRPQNSFHWLSHYLMFRRSFGAWHQKRRHLHVRKDNRGAWLSQRAGRGLDVQGLIVTLPKALHGQLLGSRQTSMVLKSETRGFKGVDSRQVESCFWLMTMFSQRSVCVRLCACVHACRCV